MNAKEFVERFIMHDCLIDAMSVDDGNATVTMTIDFAFWMQKGYRDGDPETGLLAVTFRNVTKLECPDELPFGDISILRVTEEEGSLRFAIMNDMTDDYYDLLIKAESIEVNTTGAIGDGSF